MSGKAGQMSTKRITVPDRFPDKPFLGQLDKRYKIARVLRARLDELENGLGGQEQLSYQEKSLCERFVSLEGWLQQQEYALAAGKPIDTSAYLQALSVFSGLLTRLGHARKTRRVDTLAARLKAIAALDETESCR